MNWVLCDSQDVDDQLPQTAGVILFFKNRDIVISQSTEEGSTADGCWATSDQSHGGVVRFWHLTRLWEFGIADLSDSHLFEHLLKKKSYS